MMIDEAIKKHKKLKIRAEETNDKRGVFYSAEEHKQLAEWLEELKFIRQWKSDVMYEFCKYDCNSVEEAWHYGYNKAIEEYNSIKELDLPIPQHFTKEQSDWIKAYCIRRNIEFYNKALDDFVNFANTMPTVEADDGEIRPMRLEEIAEQLKAGVKE